MANVYYLVSQSGFENLGDDLILLSHIKRIRDFDDEGLIFIDSSNPGGLGILLREHTNLVIVDYVWRLSSKMFVTGLASLNHIKHLGGPYYILEEIMKGVTHVHMLGGGYINSIFKSNYLIVYILAELKKRFKYNLIATGQGLMPTRPDLADPILRAFQMSLPFFDLFDCRDVPTYNFVSKLMQSGASLTSDDLVLGDLSMYQVLCDTNSHGRVILAIHSPSDIKILLNFCAEIVRNRRHNVNHFVFLALSEEDIGVAYHIAPLLDEGIKFTVTRYQNLLEDGFVFNCNDYIVTTKFHAHFIAAYCGIPGICSSPDGEYYEVKHQSLIMMGSHIKLIGMHDHIHTPKDWIADDPLRFRENLQERLQLKLQMLKSFYN